MPRRPPVALALLALTTACAGAPSETAKQGVTVPSVNGLPASTLIKCRALKDGLPDQLATGLARRQANPVSDTTAAWGDPPVTLRCGVAEGSARDQPYTINEVQWAMHDSGASRTWTTRGRTVNLSVEIPDAYSNQAELVGTVSFVVVTTLS